MDSKSFSQRLSSAIDTQSIYEAIKLHDRHPAGIEEDNVQDDAQLDEANLDARFQDQDLDALLADAGQSGMTTNNASHQDEPAAPTHERQGEQFRAGSVSDASKVDPGDDDDDVPTSLLMEGRESESPPLVRRDPTRWQSSHRFKADPGRQGASESRHSTQQHAESDDAPSILFPENSDAPSQALLRNLPPKPSDTLPVPVPGPSAKRPLVRWGDSIDQFAPPRYGINSKGKNLLHTSAGPVIANPAERAMWMWANVENLDNFLADVYEYFRGKGVWSILLSRFFEQLTLAFVVGFGTFLMSCIDYAKLPGSKALPEVVIPQCTSEMSGLSNLMLWFVSFYWLYTTLRIGWSLRKYWAMHEFFTYLLQINEDELQTITWQAIVSRLMNLRSANARTVLDIRARNRKYLGERSKQRMDAHDIANRLMRKDNYLIALFNKDILNLNLPLPYLRRRQFFSRNLEWNIDICILRYVFNESGEVSQLFMRDSHRQELIEGLQRRFQIMGFVSIMSAPFLVTYFLWVYFLRYFNEFQKNPSQIGSRSYTPLAEWKFREFNELYNFFERRLNMSRPFANRYLDQFPKDKVSQSARFVAFVAGSLASVLGLVSLLDPDLFLGFEITKERTVLFYLGIFGTVWAVARGMVAEDEDNVFDPEYAINNVAEFTHYKPSHWEGRLHSEDVRKEFAQLYQMKIVIFLEEIFSIVFTPFVLWFSLPDCSARIVDFFREFTVHVDGLGNVCSFALFEFQKEGVGKTNLAGSATPRAASSAKNELSPQSQDRHVEAGDDIRQDYYATKDNKMLSSYYNFIDSYANNPTGRAFNRHLDRRRFRQAPRLPNTVQKERMNLTSGERSAMRRNKANNSGVFSRQLGPKRMRHPLDDSATSPSLLLDAQHQAVHNRFSSPRETIRESLTQSRAGSKLVSSRHREPASRSVVAASSSAVVEEDSNLGDSWKMHRATDEDGDAQGNTGDGARMFDGDVGEEAGRGGNDAGVLGLLYEFQKAQTQGGRSTGVKI